MTSFRAIVAASMILGQANETPHHEQLKILEPLVGTWEAEGTIEEDSEFVKKGDKWSVQMNIFWVLDEKFLQWEWSVSLNEKQVFTGKQFAAWNPKTKKIVQWWCDTNGAHGTGEWDKRADGWVLHLSGIDPEGKVVSVDRIVSVKEDTQSSQDTNLKEDGEDKPDGKAVVLKRVKSSSK